jgi:altronate dehydratase small subunit
MKENAVLIRPNDSVVTVTESVPTGGVVIYPGGKDVKASSDIPVYHKVAIADVKKGAVVYKYGQKIGIATQDIKIGDHVHEHNLESDKGA